MRIAFNNLFSTDFTLASIKSYFEEVDIEYSLEENSDLDFTLLPLHLLSVGPSLDFSIYSLLSMYERRNFLLVRKDVHNAEDRIGLIEDAEILVSEHFVTTKMLTIKKNIAFKRTQAEEVLKQVVSASTKYAIAEGCFVSKEIGDRYHIVELDEREFGHIPGQGFLALTGPLNHPLGKLLRKKTARDHVQVCNIERKMADLAEENINNHCEVDQSGNIQLWVFGEGGDIHLSQSTRLNIEDKALEKLKSLT